MTNYQLGLAYFGEKCYLTESKCYLTESKCYLSEWKKYLTEWKLYLMEWDTYLTVSKECLINTKYHLNKSERLIINA